jgi:DNA uptake protein ComE-like DNA-binding protein
MKLAKEFFTWSKNERIGVIALSVFLISMFIGDVFFERIYPFSDNSIHPDTLVVYQHILEELEKRDAVSNVGAVLKSPTISNETKIKMPFYPNDLNINGWEKLGFSFKQAQSLVNYKVSMGGFKTKEDVASSFVISKRKFKDLEPYIRFHASNRRNEDGKKALAEKNVFKEEDKVEERIYIDLNSVDSIRLLRLKGIGPFYSGKIITYRNQLGGYASIEQLLEIWKFDKDKLDGIRKNIWVDTSLVIQLKLNTDSILVLKRHAYLDWNHANAIVKYREQHGQFETKEGLEKIMIFNDSLLNKLYPYISLD